MHLGEIKLTPEYQEILAAIGIEGKIGSHYALINNGSSPVHLIDVDETNGFDEEANVYFVPDGKKEQALTILAPGEGTNFVYGDHCRCFAKGSDTLTVALRTNYGLMT